MGTFPPLLTWCLWRPKTIYAKWTLHSLGTPSCLVLLASHWDGAPATCWCWVWKTVVSLISATPYISSYVLAVKRTSLHLAELFRASNTTDTILVMSIRDFTPAGRARPSEVQSFSALRPSVFCCSLATLLFVCQPLHNSCHLPNNSETSILHEVREL